jgi:hypothetical protein
MRAAHGKGMSCEVNMAKNILISGFLGGAVMFAVMLACRLFLPGLVSTEFRSMPNQVPIQAALKERITEPGTYVSPYLPPDKRDALFPDYLNEPVFIIRYTGYTHGTVPGFFSAGMLAFLLGPMAAAWLLAQASERVLAAYSRRVLFVAALGAFYAVSGDLLRTLSEEQPFRAVAGMMAISVTTWALVGLVLAWRIKR